MPECYSLTVTDTSVFKKMLAVFRRLGGDVAVRVSKRGVKFSIVVDDRIYAETFWAAENLLNFSFNPRVVAAAENFPGCFTEERDDEEDDEKEYCRVFILASETIKSIMANIGKWGNVKIYQESNEGVIYLGYDQPESSGGKPDRCNPRSSKGMDYNTPKIKQVNCSTSCRDIGNFFKRSAKAKSSLIIHLHAAGLNINNESTKVKSTGVNAEYSVGNINSDLIFSRSINKNDIRVIFDLVNITPSGIVKFFVHPEDQILKISTPVSFLGSMNVYFLPCKENLIDEDSETDSSIED